MSYANVHKRKPARKTNAISGAWGSHPSEKWYQRWREARPLEPVCTYRNVPTSNRKDLKSFLCIMNYFIKYSPVEMCKPLIHLNLVKTESTLNWTYDEPCNTVKAIIKENVCVKFYNEKEQLYLEVNMYAPDLGAGLLQAKEGMNYPCEEAPDNTVQFPVTITICNCPRYNGDNSRHLSGPS